MASKIVLEFPSFNKKSTNNNQNKESKNQLNCIEYKKCIKNKNCIRKDVNKNTGKHRGKCNISKKTKIYKNDKNVLQSVIKNLFRKLIKAHTSAEISNNALINIINNGDKNNILALNKKLIKTYRKSEAKFSVLNDIMKKLLKN